MCKLLSGLSKQKKISEDWKKILVEDNAWKLDLQEPSPVKKMFDPKELPFKPDLAAKRKSLMAAGTEPEKHEQNHSKPDLTRRRSTKPIIENDGKGKLDKNSQLNKRKSIVSSFVR